MAAHTASVGGLSIPHSRIPRIPTASKLAVSQRSRQTSYKTGVITIETELQQGIEQKIKPTQPIQPKQPTKPTKPAQPTKPTHPTILGLDLETYSSEPLPKCGVYRYTDSPDFEILLLSSYAFDDAPVETIDLASGEAIPVPVLAALEDPNVVKSAYNASFERVCLTKYLGRRLDPHQWRCTMVMSAYLTLPSRLADVAVALGTSEKKMDEGKDLIRYFSVPCKPTKANGGRTRNLPTDAPDKWAVYKQYNAQDVETERAIRKALEKYPMPEQEWELYALDQQIND